MTIRKVLPAALTLVVAAGALAPAVAAPPKPKPKPKPIVVEWSMQHAPIPLPLVGEEALDGTNSCADPAFEGISTTFQTIKTTGAGTLQVDLTGFAGDWDITVMDGKGKVLGIGSGTTTGGEVSGSDGSLGTDNVEKAVIKVKKATTLVIGACNFLGGPNADGKLVFTYS
jgi:hypothetical protein